MRSLPGRLLKIAWSAVLALLILGFGQGVWGVLLVANLKTIPHHPLGRPSDDVGPGADVSIPQREVVASQNLGGATQLSAGAHSALKQARRIPSSHSRFEHAQLAKGANE